MSMRPPHMQWQMSDPSVALRKAAVGGQLLRLAWLAKAGGGVRFCNNLQIPILHDTINAGQPRAARLLMNSGADIHCATSKGVTPLMAAAAAGDVALVTALVKEGADINHGDIKRATALHHAAAAGQAGTYDALIALGADTELLDLAGLCALDVATDELRTHLQTAPSLAHGNRAKLVRMRTARRSKTRRRQGI